MPKYHKVIAKRKPKGKEIVCSNPCCQERFLIEKIEMSVSGENQCPYCGHILRKEDYITKLK